MSLLDRYEVRTSKAVYTVELVEREDASPSRRVGCYLSTPDGWVEELPPKEKKWMQREAAARRIRSLVEGSRMRRITAARNRKTAASKILPFLASRGGQPMETKAIAEALGLHSGNSHRALDALRVAGLVVRGHATRGKSWTWTLAEGVEVSS